ncbi:MAG: hypothetical protein LBL75_03540 [Rickettsiales bacterium]|jgi:hypothetical protein|nr:hypothetical protein [Rickettsiales bacterium]
MKTNSVKTSKKNTTKPVSAAKSRAKTGKFNTASQNVRIVAAANRLNIFVRSFRAVRDWVRGLDIAVLTNLALLILIIILFIILIGQATTKKCVNTPPQEIPTIVAQRPVNNVVITEASAPARINTRTPQTTIVLPLKRDMVVSQPVIRRALPVRTTIQPAIKINGDVVVDGASAGKRLAQGTKINGTLILQNMRNFQLPCGVKINGNLVVRNVKNLKFCGTFSVNGNIYVGTDSAFGPIPSNARVLGQIIM